MSGLLSSRSYIVGTVLAVACACLGFSVEPADAVLSKAVITTDSPDEAADSAAAMAAAAAGDQPVEDLSQRTETTQVFANPDGSWTSEIATSPVRVQDDSGRWENVDLTLEERYGVIVPKASATDVAFSGGGDRLLAQISEDSKDLAWRLPNSDAVLPEPVLEGATATYPNVAPGQDLVVTATVSGFSHSVVLHERPMPGVSVDFALPITTDGAKLTESAQGDLSITTHAGDVVVAAPQPMMWDSSEGPTGQPENIAPVDVTVTQPGNITPEGTTAGSSPVVTLSPDEAFLSDPDTQYPVTVDPTYSTTSNGDTWAQNADFTSSQAGSDELRAGSYDSGTHKARSWLRFDTTPLSGKKINSAAMSLLNWWSQTCSGSAVRVSRITSDWVAVPTPGRPLLAWNNQPTVTYTDAADSSTAKGYSSSCPGAWVGWDVTNIVQGWANGNFANHGLRVNAVSETVNSGWRRFRSTNYASNNPTLSVNYNSPPTVIDEPEASPVEWGITNTATPILLASMDDPDGGYVRARFELVDALTSEVVWSKTSEYVSAPGATSVEVPAGVTRPRHPYKVRVVANDGSLDSSQRAGRAFMYDDDASEVFVSSSGRLIDTGATPAVGPYSTPMPAGVWRSFPVLGNAGIPANDVSSVLVTITADAPSGSGVVEAKPEASQSTQITYLNYTAGNSLSNTAVLPIGADGTVQMRASSATNLTVDIQGYTTVNATSGGGFSPIPGARIVDTRSGVGLPAAKLGSGSTSTVQVTGQSDISDASIAVAVNITVLDATANGSVTAYAADQSRPDTSLDFGPATATSLTAIVPLSAAGDPLGAFKLDVNGAPVDVTVDVLGYVSSEFSGGFHTATKRILDTRTAPEVAVPANGTRSFDLAGVAGLDAGLTASALLHVAALPTTSGSGEVSIWPEESAELGTPALNYVPGAYASNFAFVGFGESGRVMIRNSGSSPVHLVLDLEGWTMGPANRALTTDVDGPDPDSDPCEWAVQPTASGVVVSHGGDTETLDVAGTDPASPTFEGEVDATPVEVTLRKGTSQGELDAMIAEGEAALEEQSEDGTAGAVDGGDGEIEVQGEFTNPPEPEPEDLEPIAYTIDVGDAVEHGVPEDQVAAATISGGEQVAPEPPSECVRNEAGEDEGAQLHTASGIVVIPSEEETSSEGEAPAGPQATAAADYPETSSAIRYRTFIPAKEASARIANCGVFLGDNRDFTNYYAARHRSRVSVFFNWPAKTVDFSKSIGTTHRKKTWDHSAKSKTASSAGIVITRQLMSHTWGRVAVSHKVGNPLCSAAGDITYYVVLEAWSDGTARATGWRVKVPAHEIYLYPKTEERGKTVFRGKASKFICLNFSCGREQLWEQYPPL